MEESSMSCLVAVARVQPSFAQSIEDSADRGQRTVHGVEFTSRHGTDGKYSWVDQRVTLILGYTPQVSDMLCVIISVLIGPHIAGAARHQSV